MSAGVRLGELSRSVLVPESDSENEDDNDRQRADAEGLAEGLVEDTQAYDDDNAAGGVLGESMITADDTTKQVVCTVCCIITGKA